MDSPWNSPGYNTGVGSRFLLQDLPNPGIEPRSPASQADSLPAEPQGKFHIVCMYGLHVYYKYFFIIWISICSLVLENSQ